LKRIHFLKVFLQLWKEHVFFRELSSTINHRFLAVNYDSVLCFFAVHQVFKIFLNESSKSTENAPIKWLQKDTKKYFLNSNVYVFSLVISLVCKTGFGIFPAHLIRLKSEKWEMPGNFKVHVSRITMILTSKKLWQSL
jgi:hypothetical protein